MTREIWTHLELSECYDALNLDPFDSVSECYDALNLDPFDYAGML